MTTLREAIESLQRQVAERISDDALSPCVLSLERAAPEPPPEAQTEAEQRAYTFGWFKALEKSRGMMEALQIIATPQRPDGTWNRDREACRQLAAEALGFHNKGGRDE